MPPSSNNTQDQSQPQNQSTTNTDPDNTPIAPLPDSAPPAAANNTTPLSSVQNAATPPEVNGATEPYSAPVMNSEDIPASNRPTLDTLNNVPPTEDDRPNTPPESLEAEIDSLPESSLPNNSSSEEPSNAPQLTTPASSDIASQANAENPAPTPAVFPESENKPKKKGFFAKLFNRN